MNTVAYLAPLKSAFEKEQDSETAQKIEAYMRDKFKFYGIKSPQRNVIQKEFWGEYGLPTDIADFVAYCWKQEQREWQLFCMETLYRVRKKWPSNFHEIVEYMVLTKSWWDTVDYISSNLVGHWYSTSSDKPDAIIDGWNEHPDFWLNRVSLIYQLKFKEKLNEELLFLYISRHWDKDEFFIRKAIGWALRQYSKTHPDRVKWFLENHALKPLSIREASKYLS
jgi:3-methyladenine DNA glycosylase AlkD